MAHVYACKGQSFWGKAELLKAANKKCTIYSTVRQMKRVPLLSQASNPFMFKHVTHLKSSQHLDDIGPCVVMATPSMLQSGLSR